MTHNCTMGPMILRQASPAAAAAYALTKKLKARQQSKAEASNSRSKDAAVAETEEEATLREERLLRELEGLDVKEQRGAGSGSQSKSQKKKQRKKRSKAHQVKLTQETATAATDAGTGERMGAAELEDAILPVEGLHGRSETVGSSILPQRVQELVSAVCVAQRHASIIARKEGRG